MRPTDACCVLCVNARVYMRDSAVIPPRYWWCVALFIAASPLSRRRGPLHTNRSLARQRGGTPRLSFSLSLTSLSPATRKRGRRMLVYARERPVRALCGGVLCGRDEMRRQYPAPADFSRPTGIKTARRTVRRTSIGESFCRENGRGGGFMFTQRGVISVVA